MPPVVYGESSASTIFPDSVLITGAPSVIGELLDQIGRRRARRYRPGWLPSCSALRSSAAVRRSSSSGGPSAADRRGAVCGEPAGATLGHGLSPASATWMSLGIVRCATPAARVGGLDREVEQRRQLCGVGDHLVVLGDVLEQMLQMHLLLVAGTEQTRFLHAGDREHGHVVELGVVETVEQVDRTRTRGRQAHAEATGLLRVARRHERCGFFVMDEDKLHLVRSGAAAPP